MNRVETVRHRRRHGLESRTTVKTFVRRLNLCGVCFGFDEQHKQGHVVWPQDQPKADEGSNRDRRRGEEIQNPGILYLSARGANPGNMFPPPTSFFCSEVLPLPLK